MGPRDIQLFMFISNQWFGMDTPTKGFRLNYTRYGEARGINTQRMKKRNVEERAAFNETVHRVASLDVHTVVSHKVRGKHMRQERVNGRFLLAEAIGTMYQGPLEGLPGKAHIEVDTWRLVPGTAWLASHALGQVGYFPTRLIELDPHNHGLLIRLGAYLGHQTAARAVYGGFHEPLAILTLLNGIREPVPADRRRLNELRTRLENSLDRLCEEGVLTSWQWILEHEGGSWIENSILFLYNRECVEQHALMHTAARESLESESVKWLIPEKRLRKKNTNPEPES
jgi:hypothetical protein